MASVFRLTSVAVMRAISLFLGTSDTMIGLRADPVCGAGNLPGTVQTLAIRSPPTPFCTDKRGTLDVAN